MDLEQCLIEYKALTLDIMERINIDESVVYLLEERQVVLDKIIELNKDTSKFKYICESLNLFELERELNLITKKELVNTKIKIESLKKMRSANLQYNSIGYIPSRFNKKI